MTFSTELKKLGLKDKEVSVYLASLELGPSTVQTIARKAQVVRATTYVILEALANKGLVTQFKEEKKTLFAAEPPRQLMRLLEKQKEEIQEREERMKVLLPELQVLMKGAEGVPTVRYFSGIEGLRAMRREMMMYSQPGDLWYTFTPSDHLNSVLAPDERSYQNQRVSKKIKNRVIFTTKSEAVKKAMLEDPHDGVERRFVPYNLFATTSGLTIFRDRIAIGAFTGKVGGVIIESEPMADMLKKLFDLAWLGAIALDK